MKNITLNSGATVAVSGGTSVPVSTDGQGLDRLDLSVDLGTSYSDDGRVVCTRAKPQPQSSSPNGKTQLRRSIKLIVPRSFTDGDDTNDTIEIKVSTDSKTTDADIQQMVSYGAQILAHAESEDFLTSGRFTL